MLSALFHQASARTTLAFSVDVRFAYEHREMLWKAPGSLEALEPRIQVRSALRISSISVGWSVTSSIIAVAAGFMSGTVVLVAFAAIGAVDALGSATLVYHFRHALRHERVSEDLKG